LLLKQVINKIITKG